MVAKRRQHVASNNVAICCVDMLRSFGQGVLSEKSLFGRRLINKILPTKSSWKSLKCLRRSKPREWMEKERRLDYLQPRRSLRNMHTAILSISQWNHYLRYIYVWIYENRVNNRIMCFFSLVQLPVSLFSLFIFAFAMTAACNSYLVYLWPHVYWCFFLNYLS